MLYLQHKTYILQTMEKISGKSKNRAIDLFSATKVLTVRELKALLNKSVRTVRYRLKDWDALRSYNKNGQYYTLREIAQFNEYGLWHFQNISFSKYGNLKQTFIGLIKNSEKAFGRNEIGKILHMDARSFVSHFNDVESINRQKIDGRYVYYVTRNQIDRLKKELVEKKKGPPITDTIGVHILALWIKNPELDASDLTKLLNKQGFQLKQDSVLDFLRRQGIEKKTLL